MENKRIITTEVMAKILKFCDEYLKKAYNTSLIEIMYTEINYKPELIIDLLIANPDIKKLFDDYDLYDIMYAYIESFNSKKLFYLSDEDIAISRNSARKISFADYSLTEDRLKKIFASLEHNMELYEKMYKDKVWVIDSSIGRSERIKISPERFFHLMGFEERDFSKKENPGAIDKFASIFPYSEQSAIKSLLTDKKDLFAVLEKLIELEREDLISKIHDGELHGIISPRKIEMKNYGFERMGIFEHSSGMIFFDRDLAERLAGYDENGKPKFTSHIQGDLILLSNFIRKYKLEFIFEPFKYYPKDNSQTEKTFKNAESLFIPEKGYEQSMFYIGQQASISERAKRYSSKDFEYTIKLEDGSSMPVKEPEEFVEFSDEDKLMMARSIINGLPQLDNEHLKEVYNTLTNGLSGMKKK